MTPLIPAHNNPQHRPAYLIGRFLQKKCTRREADELDEWICASDDNLLLFEALTDPGFLEALALNPALIEAFGHYHHARQQKRRAPEPGKTRT